MSTHVSLRCRVDVTGFLDRPTSYVRDAQNPNGTGLNDSSLIGEERRGPRRQGAATVLEMALVAVGSLLLERVSHASRRLRISPCQRRSLIRDALIHDEIRTHFRKTLLLPMRSAVAEGQLCDDAWK